MQKMWTGASYREGSMGALQEAEVAEMIEGLIAVGMTAILLLLFQIGDALTDAHVFSKYAVYLICGALQVYVIVRFVKWAWVTPMPFIGR